MRKNGSRQISVKQYRFTDLFVFAIILAVSEVIGYVAAKAFPDAAVFTVSFSVTVVLLVMLRWGWQSAIFAVVGGLITCLINLDKINGLQWACYLIGNAFVALMLIPRYLIGTKRIASKWWSVSLFSIGGWLCTYLGRSIVWAIGFAVSPIAGAAASSGFVLFLQADLLSLVIGVLAMLLMRRLDGMVEDQNDFLRRFDDERKQKQKHDAYYDNDGRELDEEALEILNRSDNGLY